MHHHPHDGADDAPGPGAHNATNLITGNVLAEGTNRGQAMDQQGRQIPLVPANADLTDFPFMPLQVARLRRSKGWLKAKRNPALGFYMVNLWTAAWHERPAGSLENDEDVLADAAMCDPAKWVEVRKDALHGWIECSDGRLYHPVVAEHVRKSWDAKLDQRWRTECARIKKHADRHDMALPRPSFSNWVSAGCPQGQRLPVPGDTHATDGGHNGETHSKGKRQGERQGKRKGERQGELDGAATASPPAPSAPPPAAEAAATRGTRLKPDFALPKQWGEWALAKYPHWTADTVRAIASKFKNHWVAKSGKDATKLDWKATWENWCDSGITQGEHPAPKAVGAGAVSAAAQAAESRAKGERLLAAMQASSGAARPATRLETVDMQP